MKKSNLHPRTAKLLELATKHPAQGYLFIGRDEEQMARAAQELLAEFYKEIKPSSKIIELIRGGNHAAVIKLTSDESNRIKLAAVKEALVGVNLTSSEQMPYRLFLLQGAGGLTPEAANSLLKVIEEPPSGVIFILTANSADRLPPTIVSRLQKIDFLSTTKADEVKTDFSELLENFMNGSLTSKFLVVYQLHKHSLLSEFVIALEEQLRHSTIDPQRKFELLAKLLRAEELLARNVSPRLVFEAIALEMSL